MGKVEMDQKERMTANHDISTTGLLLQSEAYLKFWHIYSRVLSAQARIKLADYPAMSFTFVR